MRAWIAGAMAVLGTLLVISGGAVIVSRAMQPAAGGDDTTTAAAPKTTTRLFNAVRSMPAADRLIGWGIVLLVLGALAAGAISFNVGANAGTR